MSEIMDHRLDCFERHDASNAEAHEVYHLGTRANRSLVSIDLILNDRRCVVDEAIDLLALPQTDPTRSKFRERL